MERVPFRRQEMTEVRVVVERDVHELPGLALMPVRARPDGGRGLDMGVRGRHVRREEDVLPGRIRPGDVEHLAMVDPIDPADHREVGEGKVVPYRPEQVERRLATEPHAAGHPFERFYAQQVLPELRGEDPGQVVRLHQ